MINKVLAVLFSVFVISAAGDRAEAAVVIVGTSTAQQPFNVDYVYFHHSGGALTIDMRANSWTGGPTGSGIRDAVMVLLVDDGSPGGALTGAFVGAYDDIGRTLGAGSTSGGGFADGSVSGLDPFVNFASLNLGDYVLAVFGASGSIESKEFQARGNFSSFRGDYQLTFSPGVTFDATSVPEPWSPALVLTGLAIMGAVNRRGRRMSD